MKRTPFNLEKPFGIEIEFVCGTGLNRHEVARAIGSKFEELDPNGDNRWNITDGSWSRNGAWDSNAWFMKTDGTAHANNSQRNRNMTGGNELVSPKLIGADGFAQLKVVLEVMNELGCEVNINCGLHVHHDLTDEMTQMGSYNANTRRIAGKVITNLILLVGRWEKIVYKMVPPSRRSGGTKHNWCQSVSDVYDTELTCDLPTGIPARRMNLGQRITRLVRRMSGEYTNFQHTRTCGLNFKKFWIQGSVEFRYQGGSLDFTKISNWVVFTQAFVNTAKTTSTINHLYADTNSMTANRQIDWMKRNLGMFKASANNPITDLGHQLVADCSSWVNSRIDSLS
tara:strand:- start:535 stop:1554 length:1020 start_codon:yes stop_codon:yes gene_type:complete